MTARQLRQEAARRIQSLSPQRLKVAVDFLGYLEQREENPATRELMRIPGIGRALARAEKDVAVGRTRNWRKVRSDV